MILFLFALEEIFIPGITLYSHRLFTGSYNTTIVDTILIHLVDSPIDALEYGGGVEVYSYGTPFSLTQSKTMGGRSIQTSVFINGIPVNDVKTGIFDLSLLSGNMTLIEVLKGGLILPGVNSTMGTGINFIKGPRRNFHFAFGGHGYLSGRLGYGVDNKGFSVDFSRYEGFRSNQDGYSGGFDLFFENLFVTGLLKKTGLPGPLPGKTPPPTGDSTAYSIYDTQEDRFIAFSYKTMSDRHLLNIYGIYSMLLPYFRYMDYTTGEQVDEWDDYRTYTVGINGFYRYAILNTGFSIRMDSAAFYRADTIWGVLTYTLSVSPSIEKMLPNRFFIGSGFNMDMGKITGRVWSSYLVAGYRGRISVFVKASRDFRKPTINELCWPLYSNPSLSPEISRNIEVGFKNSILSITGYYRDLKDMIGYDASFKPINVNRAYIKGIDLMLHFTWSHGKINFTYNWVEGIEKLLIGNETYSIPLEYTPKNRATLFVYTLKDPNLFLGVRYRDYMVKYIRATDSWLIHNLPSYLVLDIGVVKRVGGVRIRGMLKNILDVEQRIWFGYTPESYYPGEPRSFSIELSGRI